MKQKAIWKNNHKNILNIGKLRIDTIYKNGYDFKNKKEVFRNLILLTDNGLTFIRNEGQSF